MFSDIGLSTIFSEHVSSGKGKKRKNEQLGLYQTKKTPAEWKKIFANNIPNRH